jgi:hypothetical protein
MPNVGDTIELFDETLHEVIRIEDKLIWYKIKYGLGQTIMSCIKQVIAKTKRERIVSANSKSVYN